MTVDEPPNSPPARALGWVWLVAGGVGVVVGVVTSLLVIVIFGVAAAVLGVALLVVAGVRDKSRRRTARTLSGDPPPPATAPYRPESTPDPEQADSDDTQDTGDGDAAPEHDRPG